MRIQGILRLTAFCLCILAFMTVSTAHSAVIRSIHPPATMFYDGNYTEPLFVHSYADQAETLIDGQQIIFDRFVEHKIDRHTATLRAKSVGMGSTLYLSELWSINQQFSSYIPVVVSMDVHARLEAGANDISAIIPDLYVTGISQSSGNTDTRARVNANYQLRPDGSVSVQNDYATEFGASSQLTVYSSNPNDVRLRLTASIPLNPAHSLGIQAQLQSASGYGGGVDASNTASISIALPEEYQAINELGDPVQETRDPLVTPEPSTFLLLGLGLILAGYYMRRVRQA